MKLTKTILKVIFGLWVLRAFIEIGQADMEVIAVPLVVGTIGIVVLMHLAERHVPGFKKARKRSWALAKKHISYSKAH